MAVEGEDGDVGKSRHHAANVGNTQAAFPAFFAYRIAFGMMSGLMITVASLSGSGSSSRSATNSRTTFVDLRRSQADAVILVHRLDHVVDELLEQRICSSDVSTGRARSRSTGCPIRATFRIDIAVNYRRRRHAAARRASRYSHCPRRPAACPTWNCGLEVNADGTPTAWSARSADSSSTRIPRSPSGTIIRNGDDQIVLVRRAIEPGYGKWVFPVDTSIAASR